MALLSAFPWASFRRRKGAVKLLTLLNLSGSIPAFVHVSDGKEHDSRAARKIPPSRDSLLVIDRGYIDYAWLKSLQEGGVRFITHRLHCRNSNWEFKPDSSEPGYDLLCLGNAPSAEELIEKPCPRAAQAATALPCVTDFSPPKT